MRSQLLAQWLWAAEEISQVQLVAIQQGAKLRLDDRR